VFHHHGPKKGPSGAPQGTPGGSPENPDKQNIVERMAGVDSGVPVAPTNAHEAQHLHEEREVLERPYAHTRRFDQNPEKKASKEHLNDFFSGKTDEIGQIWRFLSVPRRMQFFLIQEPNAHIKQVKFIKMHRSEVWANYRMDMEIYAKTPAIKKVPLVSLPAKERNDIITNKPIFLMGGSLSAAMAGDPDLQAANAKNIVGADNPQKARVAFMSLVADHSDEELQGSTVVLSFDPEMFAYELSAEQLKSDTAELLNEMNKKGIKVVMTTPLPVTIQLWNQSDNYIGGSKSAQEAKEIRKDYLNFMAEMYQKGHMHAIVDVAEGMKKRLRGNSSEFKLVYYNNPRSLADGLNAEGVRVSVNGVIDGINLANGKTTGRTNASGEMHYYGAGDTYARGGAGKEGEDAHPPTIELIPDHEEIQSISKLPHRAKMAIWRISYMHMCADLGLYELDEQNVKMETYKAEKEINAIADPKQREFARMEFLRQKASIYYMYAWQALKKREFDRALTLIQEARDHNQELLNTQRHPIFKTRLERLERLAKNQTDVSYVDQTPRVHNGKRYPDEEEARKYKKSLQK